MDVDKTNHFEEEYNRDDPSSLGYFMSPVTVTSFLITLSLSLVVSPTISPLLTSKYYSLGLSKRTFDTLWASTLHALALSSLALYLLATGKMGTDSLARIYSKEPLGFAAMQVALGYFSADLIVCLSDKKLRNDKVVIVHHLVAMTSVSLGLYHQGRMMYLVVLWCTTEVSTPFVNLWHILRLTGNTNICWRAYLLASIGLWMSFFLCRIVTIPWHWYVTLTAIMHPAFDMMIGSEYKYIAVAYLLALDALNMYWFYRLTVGGTKMLRRLRKKTYVHK